MADRPIDRHEIRRSARPSSNVGHINRWRDAWLACYQVVQDWPSVELTRFHDVFQVWISTLNWVFEHPISNLERYEPTFYYCNENPGPKEIVQLYMGENRLDDRIPVYVVFNLFEFRKIHRQYCANMTKSNRMLVDEARGTINVGSFDEEYGGDPAAYFQNMTAWQLLFIFTLHALAHWDAYDKYDHCHYDSHMHVRDSPFFKLYFYGQIVYRRE